jgi:hypothetical protein
MFIKNAFRAKHEFWRYLVGSLIAIVASVIGQLPFLIVLLLNKGFEGLASGQPTTGLGKNTDLLLLLLSFPVGMIGLYIAVKYLHNQKWKEILTSRLTFDWKRFFFSFFLITAFIVGSTYYDYQMNPEMYEWNFKLIPFIYLFIIAVVLIPIQTGLEEFLFRGYLMQGFGLLAKNRWFPLLMTSLIFGGLHFFNPEVSKMGSSLLFYYIGTGLFLGILTLLDDGLELSFGFHAANNMIGVLLVTSDWAVISGEAVLKDLSEPTAGAQILMPLLIFYPIVLLIFALVYKWKNWGNKLFGKIEEPESVIE